MSSFCVLSDSGTLTEEASLLKFPAIMIRGTHERPEGVDSGILIMSGFKSERILESVRVSTSKNSQEFIKNYDIDDYNNKYVSKQITKIILSYIEYINFYIWHKK